jgi:SAM-dependent methyltransferase
MEECNSPYSGISELADAEQGLLNYYSNIIDLVAGSFLRTKSSVSEISVLEFGAGTGFLSELLQEKFNVKADCLEIDPTLLEILQQKGFNTYSKLIEIDKKYDLIFSSNVLEHIEKDVEVLNNLRQLLKPTGELVNYIPAFPILFSGLDVSVGHFRRYTKRELKLKLEEAGYKVDKIHYVDSLGFPASLLLRIIGYRSRGNIGGLRSMRIYDRYIFPFSKILDQIGFKWLFGKNIVVYSSLNG